MLQKVRSDPTSLRNALTDQFEPSDKIGQLDSERISVFNSGMNVKAYAESGGRKLPVGLAHQMGVPKDAARQNQSAVQSNRESKCNDHDKQRHHHRSHSRPYAAPLAFLPLIPVPVFDRRLLQDSNVGTDYDPLSLIELVAIAHHRHQAVTTNIELGVGVGASAHS
jgi:hypothetical protein